MTPEQVAMVQATVDRLEPRLVEVADDFYSRLFDDRPDLRDKFSDDIEVQRRKFAEELKVIVTAIPDFGRFRARAVDLGARHRTYGVGPSHYAPVRESLLAALAAADTEWDDDIRAAWRSAYDLVAELMQAGSDLA